MFKERKQSLVVLLALVLALGLGLVLGKTPAFAANVSNFNELKTAVETGGDIQLTNDITVTETLVIKNDVTISGGTLKANDLITSDPKSGNIFYVNDGKKLKLDGVTLDGGSKSRLIYSNGGTIELKDSTLQKGCPGANAKANPGGGVFLRGGSLTATDTIFKNNTPGTNTSLPKGDGDVNGGAIYSGSTSADIKITRGSFEGNEVKTYGHGAAIYQENGNLTVTGTSFKNNKGHTEGGNAGTQGACIHTRDKVKATISGVTAEIAKGFNTGGFLRAWGSDVTVTGSTFTIKDQGDGYGYSGGALCFENGTSKVEKSTFTCTGSKLYHAGGFIDIVGGGTHVIDNNTMTGGGKENSQQIASFGGAISVEEGAKADVTITGNTIKDSSASDNGGAIAIGTHKGVSTPSKVTMSGNKISNAGTLFWGAQHRGGTFIGPDAKVTMSNDIMSDTRSSYGGGIYNEGDLTISGGSLLTGGVGSKLGGEIYNNGALTVDNATIKGNFVGGAAWQQYASHGKNFELGGTNIYAEKSVTITPEANLATGKDVRVLDGQSKILLTGPLTKEIDVSISEIAGVNETQNRKVGYVVAEGTKGYSATKADAKNLHYIGKTNAKDPGHYSNQPRAEFDDDTGTGEWDFVLSPTKQVVLGQRAELIFDGNGGAFDGQETDKKVYTFYSSEAPFADKTDMKAEKTPKKEGYQFVGWAEDKQVAFDSADAYLAASVKKFDDSKSYMSLQANQTGPITDILNPHTKTVYALWVKQIEIPVNKVWGQGTKDEQKQEVKLTLTGGAAAPLTLNEANGWRGQFENVDTIAVNGGTDGKDGKITDYSVSEVSIPGFTSKTTGNATDGFTVTNTPIEETVDISVNKNWVDAEESDKVEVTVNLLANGQATDESVTLNANNQWTATFAGLAKKDASGQAITYTVNESAVNGFTSEVTGDAANGFMVTNTKINPIPEDKVNVQVTKNWVDAEESDKVEVTVNLLANGQATDETVTLNVENQWTGIFENLAKNDENGDAITYTVIENDVEGFTSKVTGDVANGFTVTNTKINPIPEDKVNVQVTKVWSGAEENDKVPVTITLKANGEATDKTVTLNAENQWTGIFENLTKNDENDKAITYTVSENAVKGFTSKITGDMHDGFTVTNTKDKPTRRPNGNGGRTETTPSGNTPTETSKGLKTQDHYQYMFGYPDYSFQQDGFMTRAEIAAMVARIIDDKPDLNRHYPSNFTDMKDSAWYDDAVGYIVDKKIMTGYPDGSFKPNAPITRAEYAQVVSKFRTLTGTDGMTFSDVPNAHWAHDAILGIATGGWVKGYPDGSFKPERLITRAEIVTITNAMLNREADKSFVDNHVGDMIHWIDLEKSHWAYYGIREATHGHDYKRVGDREEEWQRLNGLKFEFPEAHYEGSQR